MKRTQTDWKSIYQSKESKHIKNLPWINSIGNHDVPHDSEFIRGFLDANLLTLTFNMQFPSLPKLRTA